MRRGGRNLLPWFTAENLFSPSRQKKLQTERASKTIVWESGGRVGQKSKKGLMLSRPGALCVEKTGRGGFVILKKILRGQNLEEKEGTRRGGGPRRVF